MLMFRTKFTIFIILATSLRINAQDYKIDAFKIPYNDIVLYDTQDISYTRYDRMSKKVLFAGKDYSAIYNLKDNKITSLKSSSITADNLLDFSDSKILYRSGKKLILNSLTSAKNLELHLDNLVDAKLFNSSNIILAYKSEEKHKFEIRSLNDKLTLIDSFTEDKPLYFSCCNKNLLTIDADYHAKSRDIENGKFAYDSHSVYSLIKDENKDALVCKPLILKNLIFIAVGRRIYSYSINNDKLLEIFKFDSGVQSHFINDEGTIHAVVTKFFIEIYDTNAMKAKKIDFNIPPEDLAKTTIVLGADKMTLIYYSPIIREAKIISKYNIVEVSYKNIFK